MEKDTLALTLELLGQVRISVTDAGADSLWDRLVRARDDVRREIEKYGSAGVWETREVQSER